MSNLHIPDLASRLAPYLSTQDLVHLCVVNNNCNTAFTPFLWRTFPTGTIMGSVGPYTVWLTRVWNKFRPLIEDDILYELQHSQLEGDNNTSKDSFIDLALPALSRNGKWIQTLFVDQLLLNKPYYPPQGKVKTANTPDTEHYRQHTQQRFSTLALFVHLLKRCPNLESLQLTGQDKLATEYNFWKRLTTVGFPVTIKSLDIGLESCVSLAKSTTIPTLFAQCPSGLHKLTINFCNWEYRGNIWMENEEIDTREDVVEEHPPLLALTELNLTYGGGNRYPPSCTRFLSRCVNLESLSLSFVSPMWSQALEDCVHLKRLSIQNVSADCLELLATALTNRLDNLNSIHIQSCDYGDLDQEFASMLLACRAGWRAVTLPSLGETSAEALIKHCSTLEDLEVSNADGLTSQQMQQILSTSPRLVRFETLAHDDLCVNENTFITAEDLIDQDFLSDQLNPWACEANLKVFRARIGGIPIPDEVKQEQYPGEKQDIQQKVYKRLARLTHLERLELGNQGPVRSWNCQRVPAAGSNPTDEWGNHIDSLDMTLDSGLRILEGLKGLRVLGVMRVLTSIGVEEVRWMVCSWPKLEAVRGLKIYAVDKEEEAANWLTKNYPQIHQLPTMSKLP
ncbi:hypothetical protein BGZ97_003807 [Linnemannia gamsii]|uniref:Uncharacterized protein n=1 Tax=Linnemannia gamsii TaxID=64522 RepID=A0A9P6UG97_9FUNG|nr:hypothetical protein BGZ97_003807 [Linnemannia gamsii]